MTFWWIDNNGDDDYDDLAGRGLLRVDEPFHSIITSAPFTLDCIRSSIVHIGLNQKKSYR